MKRKTKTLWRLLWPAAVTVPLLIAAATARAQFLNVYNESANAHTEIREALQRAAREHKRVLLDFGGNWCGDCKVLDIYFHQEPNAALLAHNFVLVDIDIGRMDKNVDLARKYEIPLRRGVPALAVLDAHGRLLYSQKNGEFESMGRVDPAAVTHFLERWKPGGRGGGAAGSGGS